MTLAFFFLISALHIYIVANTEVGLQLFHILPIVGLEIGNFPWRLFFRPFSAANVVVSS
jgi:hypothetical protein